jgi:hypothetical protein
MRRNTTTQKDNSMEHCWHALTGAGYPIRVEEHWSDLSYIIEFYDSDEPASAGCITHCPISGEPLSLESLRPAVADADLYPVY